MNPFSKAGDFMRIQRGALGLTLQQVADLAGTTRQAVAQWEAGKTAPKTNRLSALFDALRLTNAQRRELVAAFGGGDGNA